MLRETIENEFPHLREWFSVRYSSIGGAVIMRVSFKDDKKRPSIIVELESFFVRLGMRQAERVASFGVEVENDKNKKNEYEFLLGNEPLQQALSKQRTVTMSSVTVQDRAIVTAPQEYFQFQHSLR